MPSKVLASFSRASFGCTFASVFCSCIVLFSAIGCSAVLGCRIIWLSIIGYSFLGDSISSNSSVFKTLACIGLIPDARVFLPTVKDLYKRSLGTARSFFSSFCLSELATATSGAGSLRGCSSIAVLMIFLSKVCLSVASLAAVCSSFSAGYALAERRPSKRPPATSAILSTEGFSG